MKTLKFTLATISICICACISNADGLKDVQRVIQANYRKMDAAYAKKDITVVENLFSPKCRFKMKGEHINVPEQIFIGGTKALFRTSSAVKSTTKLVSFTSSKEGYLATINWTGQAKPISKDGKPKKFEGTKQTVFDTWHKTPKGWKITTRLIEAG